MAIRFSSVSKWLPGRKHREKPTRLEDVQPLHPDEYPARHLKAKLDERREESADRRSQPTGMLDGPGPLT